MVRPSAPLLTTEGGCTKLVFHLQRRICQNSKFDAIKNGLLKRFQSSDLRERRRLELDNIKQKNGETFGDFSLRFNAFAGLVDCAENLLMVLIMSFANGLL